MPSVSIITTFYNASNTLVDTIESVLQQDFEDYEYILVDDGSDDNSCSIVNEYLNSKVCLLRPGRVGRVGALNEGLHAAQGRYIAILDADDCCFKQRLSLQFEQLNSQPELALVYSNAELISVDGDVIGATQFPSTHDAILNSLVELNPFPHSSVMYQRELALKIGGYNWRCEKSIDYNFYLALVIAGGKLQGSEKTLIQLRSHADSWGKQDKQALQIRYGIIGLVNYYQKQQGQVGIMQLDSESWEREKTIFNQWFDRMNFQQQMTAKQHFSRARQSARNIDVIGLIKSMSATLSSDPWFWCYRGCNFTYPNDVERFIIEELGKE